MSNHITVWAQGLWGLPQLVHEKMSRWPACSCLLRKNRISWEFREDAMWGMKRIKCVYQAFLTIYGSIENNGSNGYKNREVVDFVTYCRAHCCIYWPSCKNKFSKDSVSGHVLLIEEHFNNRFHKKIIYIYIYIYILKNCNAHIVRKALTFDSA